jgi:hypothetical protein
MSPDEIAAAAAAARNEAGGGGARSNGNNNAAAANSSDRNNNNNAPNAEITPLEVDPSIGFDSVGGLDSYVTALKEMVRIVSGFSFFGRFLPPLSFPPLFASQKRN